MQEHPRLSVHQPEQQHPSSSSSSSYFILLQLLLLLVFVFPGPRLGSENPYVAGSSFEYSGACDQLTCKIGEQCVSRKFWCTQPPCPNMTYCSKSRKELLKGPETCESVICPMGYKCLVRVRGCEWNKKCKQRTARCVSEREYEEGPASCADVVCPTGHRCVLRETHCFRPPCKLTKSCARDRDVSRWFDKCRKMACRSEHNCFLRRPPAKCASPPCDQMPDCLETTYFGESESLSSSSASSSSKLDPRCLGWICPIGQECAVHGDVNCRVGDCRLDRSCRESILLLPDVLRSSPQIKVVDDLDEMEPTRKWSTIKNPSQSSTSTSSGIVTKSRGNTRSTSFDDSTWLTYLKRKAGAEAVQHWMEKAKNNEDYEGFSDWLDQVARLLGPDTYRLWLSEVELLSIDTPELQAWLTTSRNRKQNSRYRSAGPTSSLTPEAALQSTYPAIPSFRAQELADTVASSWKTWQSYYRLKTPSNERQLSDHSNSNETRQNNSETLKELAAPMDQPLVFFPSEDIPGKSIDSGRIRWYQRRSEDEPNNAETSDSNKNLTEEFSGLGSLLDSLSGFQQFRDVKPNIFRLSSNNLEEVSSAKGLNFDNQHPNFLIYFPPPYNFLIYYSDEKFEKNSTKEIKVRDSNLHAQENRTKNDENGRIGKDLVTMSNKQSFDSILDNPDKRKRREHIRKFFRELLEYLNEEDKCSDDQSGRIPTANTESSDSSDSIDDDDDDEIPLISFLEWLTKNSSLLEAKIRKKLPPIYNETYDRGTILSPPKPKVKPYPLPFWPSNTTYPKKFRILVDIDQNPEVMEALFSRNKTGNGANQSEYQVIINLEDFVNPEEKKLITRKLVDIAQNQFHRNLTRESPMPRSLWVFPMYDDTGLKIPNRIYNNEKRITLMDVDFPTDARGNDELDDIYNTEEDYEFTVTQKPNVETKKPLLGPRKSRYSLT